MKFRFVSLVINLQSIEYSPIGGIFLCSKALDTLLRPEATYSYSPVEFSQVRYNYAVCISIH